MAYRQTRAAEHPALSLYNDDVELIALPAVGARIAYLRRRAGREWLWRNTSLPFRSPPSTIPLAPTAYVDRFDSGGWDECFPTVGWSTLPGAPGGAPPLPDHGELWCAAWSFDLLDGPDGTVWRGRAACRSVPAEFVREVRVPAEGSRVEFHYRLQSTGDRPFPYLWSAHPLFICQPGTALELPGVSRVRVAAAEGRHDLAVNSHAPWPPGGGERFVVPPHGGWALKLFADSAPEGVARLMDPSRGEVLELRWSGAEIPQLGLWLNAGGWAPGGIEPYTNLAIEPCLGAPDRLDQAVAEWGVAPILHPGEVRTWRLTVLLREE